MDMADLQIGQGAGKFQSLRPAAFAPSGCQNLLTQKTQLEPVLTPGGFNCVTQILFQIIAACLSLYATLCDFVTKG